jgi:hypothetical protein
MTIKSYPLLQWPFAGTAYAPCARRTNRAIWISFQSALHASVARIIACVNRAPRIRRLHAPRRPRRDFLQQFAVVVRIFETKQGPATEMLGGVARYRRRRCLETCNQSRFTLKHLAWVDLAGMLTQGQAGRHAGKTADQLATEVDLRGFGFIASDQPSNATSIRAMYHRRETNGD